MKNYAKKGLAFGLVMVLAAAMFVLIVPMNASAGWTGDLVIYSDGSYTSGAPVSVIGNKYTLTDNIYGTITIEKSGITLIGDGYSVKGDGTTTGIYGTDLSHVTFKEVILEDHDCGIRLDYTSDCKLSENTVSNNHIGFYLYYSDDNTLKENTASNNLIRGFTLWHSNSNTLKENIASYNNGGFLIQYSNSNTIKENTFTYNFQNVLSWANYNIFTENKFLGSTSNGMNVAFSNNNVIKKNIISESGEDDAGLMLIGSAKNIISENIISDNYKGIDLMGFKTTGNIITKNTISNNDYGFYLRVRTRNEIYHNNIIDNTIQAQEAGMNTWDNGAGEGNYWSDYTGSDTDNDGIGDTGLPHAGVDYYPLMDEYIE
jgi:parallel beta-helix repeat protein